MTEKQEIINYVFKDEPNPYVLDSMLTEIGGEGGSSESGKYKDVTIKLINDNIDIPYFYKDFLNQEIHTTVHTEATVHIPILNTSSDGNCISRDYIFGNYNLSHLPVCTGNIEYDSTRGLFFITGNGTITLTGGGIK